MPWFAKEPLARKSGKSLDQVNDFHEIHSKSFFRAKSFKDLSPLYHPPEPGVARCLNPACIPLCAPALRRGLLFPEAWHDPSSRSHGVYRHRALARSGQFLTGRQPVEVWQREAGMDWSIAHSDVLFNVADDGMLMCGYCPAQIPGTVRSCVSGSLIQG